MVIAWIQKTVRELCFLHCICILMRFLLLYLCSVMEKYSPSIVPNIVFCKSELYLHINIYIYMTMNIYVLYTV